MNSSLVRQWLSPSYIKSLLARESVRSILIVAFLTGASRGLGMFRQMLFYFLLGEVDSDILISADKIQDVLGSFLLVGTVYSSVLPISSRLDSGHDGSKRTSGYLNLIMIFLVILITFLVALMIIFTEPILNIFTSSELWEEIKSQGKLDTYILITRILCLIPIAVAIQSIFGVFLNLKGKFFIFSLGGVINNLGAIAGVLLSQNGPLPVAIGMTSSWIVVNILFLVTSLKFGYKLPKIFNFKKIKLNRPLISIKSAFLDEILTDIKTYLPELILTFSLFLPRLFLIDGIYIARLIINPFAQNSGQITAFEIGTSLSSGFFILSIALGTVAFPDLSRSYEKNKSPEKINIFWSKLNHYIFSSLNIGFLITILAFVFSPIILILDKYLGGQDNGFYIMLISQITSLALPFRSVREIFSRYLFVRERVWQPVIFSALGFSFQLFFAVIMNFYNIDTGLTAGLSLVIYNLIWVLGASYYINKDYKLDHMLNHASKS